MSQGGRSAAEDVFRNYKQSIDGVIALIERDRAQVVKDKKLQMQQLAEAQLDISRGEDALFLLDTLMRSELYRGMQGAMANERDIVERQYRAAQEDEQILRQNIADKEQREEAFTGDIDRLRDIKKRIDAAT